MVCPGFSDPQFFFFSSEVPPLLYYSHIPTALVALLFGFFVLRGNRESLAGKTLFSISLVFALWVLADLVTWTNNRSDVISFVWSFFGILYAGLSLLSVYFVYVFINKTDVPFRLKSIFLLILLPLFVLTPSAFNIKQFTLNLCGVYEGQFFTNYYYSVGFLAFFWILALVSWHLWKGNISREEKRQVLFMGIGIEFFLLLFFVSGFLASFLVESGYMQDYSFEQYGLFGMPVFMGFLAYLIVRYRAFNIRLLAVQALVVGLSILIGAQLFFVKTQVNFILTSVTFLLSITFGIMLIRSVKNEIKRKEELQIVTDKLADANVELKRLDRSKTEFISIASHQLRTPLTAIKGFVSLLLEGSYGAVPKGIEEILNKVYTANERIIDLVEDLLNISRMESGRLTYEYVEVDLCEFLNELRDTFAIVAEKKGIELLFECPEGETLPPVLIDRKKSFEVVSNLIDNALKYTREGSVCVRAEAVAGAVRVSVIDTGIGISEEAKRHLFSKFTRGKESEKMFANGTGLGLYVGKAMMEAQGGRISVESEGVGKGSTFSVEFPVKA